MTDGPAPGGQETGASPAPGPPPGKVTPTPGQAKEVNISTVCRIGQETVEEIVSRTQEVFSILKSLKPPVGSYSKMAAMEDQNNLEKQNRLNEVLKGIGMLFKRLRVCWDKCGENTSGLVRRGMSIADETIIAPVAPRTQWICIPCRPLKPTS